MSLPEPRMKHIDGMGPRMAYELACNDCRKAFVVARPQNYKSHSDSEMLAERLVSRELDSAGWSYKKNLRHLLCPSCQQARKTNQENNIVELKKAEPPREITREARRRIADLLETVYDVDAGHYTGEESDKSVAETLSYPRAWVKEVREALFGDHDRNEVDAQVSKEAAALEGKIAGFERQYGDLAKVLADLRKEVEALKARGRP